jgi:NAD-specific glutamate dehydrogenase
MTPSPPAARQGYDHKKMGITARGAWEAVKRHFREMDIDIQTTPFTAAGVGDMSGDVFGNGMLLSTQIRLIAAFDHRDIFIDPDPDCDRLCRTQAAVRSGPVELAGLRQVQALQGAA